MCLSLSLLVVGPTPASAQSEELGNGQVSGKKLDELTQWIRLYNEWEEWFELWGNRVARNFNDQPIWERKKRPDPPVWLEEACQGFLGAQPLLERACDILRHWDEQPLQILQRRNSSLVKIRRQGRRQDCEEFVLSTSPSDRLVDAGTISSHSTLRRHRDADFGVRDLDATRCRRLASCWS